MPMPNVSYICQCKRPDYYLSDFVDFLVFADLDSDVIFTAAAFKPQFPYSELILQQSLNVDIETSYFSSCNIVDIALVMIVILIKQHSVLAILMGSDA